MKAVRDLVRLSFPSIRKRAKKFRPVACEVCGAILVRKLDSEGNERNYCGHCGTFL